MCFYVLLMVLQMMMVVVVMMMMLTTLVYHQLVKATFTCHLYCRRRRLRPVLTLVASAL